MLGQEIQRTFRHGYDWLRRGLSPVQRQFHAKQKTAGSLGGSPNPTGPWWPISTWALSPGSGRAFFDGGRLWRVVRLEHATAVSGGVSQAIHRLSLCGATAAGGWHSCGQLLLVTIATTRFHMHEGSLPVTAACTAIAVRRTPQSQSRLHEDRCRSARCKSPGPPN